MIVGVSTIGIIKGIGTAQDRHSATKSIRADAIRKALVFFFILPLHLVSPVGGGHLAFSNVLCMASLE